MNNHEQGGLWRIECPCSMSDTNKTTKKITFPTWAVNGVSESYAKKLIINTTKQVAADYYATRPLGDDKPWFKMQGIEMPELPKDLPGNQEYHLPVTPLNR